MCATAAADENSDSVLFLLIAQVVSAPTSYQTKYKYTYLVSIIIN